METEDKVNREGAMIISEKDREMARAAQRCIMASLDHSRAAVIKLKTDKGDAPEVEVPPASLKMIGQVLGALSEGQAVTIVPTKMEFTTVEAAHFLNVSRPFVIKEIEAGRLRHRMVGTHRRIAFADLREYQRRMREGQHAALQNMADHADSLNLDY